MRVAPTYVVLGCMVLLMALAIGRTEFPPIHSDHEDSGDRGHFSELFHYPQLWLAVVTQFFYVLIRLLLGFGIQPDQAS